MAVALITTTPVPPPPMMPQIEKRKALDEMSNNLRPFKRARPSSEKTSTKRRVTFGEPQIKTFEKDYTASDYENIWWSPMEMRQLAHREIKCVQEKINCDSSTCYRESIVRVLVHSIKHAQDEPSEATQKAAIYIAYSELRGMERDFVGILRKRRCFSTSGILAAQKDLKEQTDNVMIRQHLLGRRCQELSHSAAVFAQMIGEADALIARLS